jgi:nitroreductase
MSDGSAPTVPLQFTRRSPEDSCARAEAHLQEMVARRSVRFFSDEPVPLAAVRAAIHTAAQAPSGAHKQPWTFALVTDPQLKREIRAAAEEEERRTYGERMSDEWRRALAPLGTDWRKPFLEHAPALIVVFRKDYDLEPDGTRSKNYYVQESCGIALGFLITALHLAGLATLTHTPSPMGFLQRLLARPANEKAFMLLPVGYPSGDCVVPELERYPLDHVLVQYGDG